MTLADLDAFLPAAPADPVQEVEAPPGVLADDHPARARFDFASPADGDDGDDKPTLLRRADGWHLLYPGAVNLLAGEPSACKSWIVQALTRDLITEGAAVLYLDYEDTWRAVKRRLGYLGAPHDALGLVYYPRILGRLVPADVATLAAITRWLRAPLIVIDGVAEALAAHGLKEDDAGQYAAWHAAVPRALARETGAAVVLLDHVPKPASSADRKKKGFEADLYPRGSGHKISALDGAGYMVTAVEPFSRETVGISDLVVAKDRGGFVGPKRARVARVTLTPIDNGNTVEVHVGRPPERTDEDDAGTGARSSSPGMDLTAGFVNDVYDAVEAATRREGPPATRTVITELRARGVRFRNDLVAPALVRLVNEGRLEQRAEGRTKTYAPPPKQGTLGA